MKVYKIRNKEGLFSTGGLTPQWKKRGKTWVALSHINSHLNMLNKYYDANTRVYRGWLRQDNPYIGCMIIEYVTQENAIGIVTDPTKKIQMQFTDEGPKQW